jgi:hypothetical protein
MVDFLKPKPIKFVPLSETLPAYTAISERSARSFSPAVAGAIAPAAQIAV